MTEEEKQALMRAITHANEEAGSDGDDQSIELESPNPAKSGRTVPYSPSKEHMSATVESHGTNLEQRRPSILKLREKERTTMNHSSSDQDGSAKFY